MKHKKAVKTLMGYGKSRNEANDLLRYSSANLSNEEICDTVFVEMLIQTFPEMVENIQQKVEECCKTLFNGTRTAIEKITEVVDQFNRIMQEYIPASDLENESVDNEE